MKIIARVYNAFESKFAIPRQSGIAGSVISEVVFEPEYRSADALRGLEGFSHIWLIWEFSENVRVGWRPTVRPPRLGGNTRVGVFATRSPFRPNPIGLSAVKLEEIKLRTDRGPVLYVSGADLMNNTPVYDIKPYLPFADSYPGAQCGFAEKTQSYRLEVHFPENLLERVPEEYRESVFDILAQDPRPAYHNDEDRIYGFEYGGIEIKFRVSGGVLTVCDAERRS